MRLSTFRAREAGSERCALCHERAGDAAVTCELCRTVCHRECLGELGGCPTIGCAKGRKWSPETTGAPLGMALVGDEIHGRSAPLGDRIAALGCGLALVAFVFGFAALSIHNITTYAVKPWYYLLCVPDWEIAALLLGAALRALVRQPVAFLGGALNFLTLGGGRTLIRRVERETGAAVHFEEHFRFGRPWVNAVIPLDDIERVQAIVGQGSREDRPTILICIDRGGGDTHYLELPERDARLVVETIEKWRARAKGA